MLWDVDQISSANVQRVQPQHHGHQRGEVLKKEAKHIKLPKVITLHTGISTFPQTLQQEICTTDRKESKSSPRHRELELRSEILEAQPSVQGNTGTSLLTLATPTTLIPAVIAGLGSISTIQDS